MSGTEDERTEPITEAEFAQMLGEDDARANGAQTDVDTEAEIHPEAPELVPEPEPESDLPLHPEDAPVSPTEVPGEPLPAELPDPEVEPDTSEIAEHLAWAERRNLMSFEDATKLAWEQEKFLGRKASEIEELRAQLAERGETTATTATTRSDDWMASALSSPDPGRYAYELATNGEWGTYEQYMQMWEQIVGESVTVGVHQQIMSTLAEQQPEEQPEEQQQRTVAEAFQLAGIYDLQNDPLVPTITSVARELGPQHPLVVRGLQGDAPSIAAIVEIARSRTVTRRTVRLDGTPVDEESRRAAASISGAGSSPTRTPPKEDPLAADKEEWRRMGVLPVE